MRIERVLHIHLGRWAILDGFLIASDSVWCQAAPSFICPTFPSDDISIVVLLLWGSARFDSFPNCLESVYFHRGVVREDEVLELPSVSPPQACHAICVQDS